MNTRPSVEPGFWKKKHTPGPKLWVSCSLYVGIYVRNVDIANKTTQKFQTARRLSDSLCKEISTQLEKGQNMVHLCLRPSPSATEHYQGETVSYLDLRTIKQTISLYKVILKSTSTSACQLCSAVFLFCNKTLWVALRIVTSAILRWQSVFRMETTFMCLHGVFPNCCVFNLMLRVTN